MKNFEDAATGPIMYFAQNRVAIRPIVAQMVRIRPSRRFMSPRTKISFCLEGTGFAMPSQAETERPQSIRLNSGKLRSKGSSWEEIRPVTRRLNVCGEPLRPDLDRDDDGLWPAQDPSRGPCERFMCWGHSWGLRLRSDRQHLACFSRGHGGLCLGRAT